MSVGAASPVARLDVIARAVGGSVVGRGDASLTGVSSLEDARADELAYVESERFADAARASRAGALVVATVIEGVAAPQLVVDDPRLAFIQIIEGFFTAPRRARGIASQVTLGLDVVIGAEPSIGRSSRSATACGSATASRSTLACSSATTCRSATTRSCIRT
jgi:UDP-3-O-[3-hydroxymyristoyl] glucosamine N-acyltransferase